MKPRSTIYVDANHAKNIIFVAREIKGAKITLPPGMELSPELAKRISKISQSTINDGIKISQQYPPSNTMTIDLPNGVTFTHLTSENEINTSLSNTEVDTEENPNRFFSSSPKPSEESPKDKSLCERIPCVIL